MTPGGGAALATSPEDLRAAARSLREVGHEASALGRALGLGMAGTSSGWSGLAALEQQARVESLQLLVGRVPGPGDEAALLLERCAMAAEDSADRVRAWTRTLEEARSTAHQLRVAGPPPDPAGLQAWQRLVAELDAQVARSSALIQQAEEDFDLVARQVAGAVREVWSDVQAGATELQALVDLGRKGANAKDKLTAARLAAPGLVALALASRDSGLARAKAHVKAMERLWAVKAHQLEPPLVEKRIRALVAKLPGSPSLPRVPPVLLRGGTGLYAMYDAAGTVVDGGGYDGWRGGVSRVLGAGAVMAAPATFSAIPPVALAGAVTLGAYTAWMTGNWVYDNRGRIVDAGRTAVRVGRRAGRAVGSAVEGGLRIAGSAVERGVRATGSAVRDGLREAGEASRALQRRASMGAAGVAFRTGQAVDGAIGRLRDRGVRELATLGGLAGEVGDGLRSVGKEWSRITLPDLPPLPRLPVELPSMPRLPVELPSLPRLPVDLPVDLPSLPRLPVELPRPVLGTPWPGGATS